MILSELIGSPVVAGGERVGRVIDLRFLLDKDPDEVENTAAMPQANLYGILVGRHARASFFGYERSEVNRPWPLAQLLRRREREAFLVLWADIELLSPGAVLLRPGARRWSPQLPPAPAPAR